MTSKKPLRKISAPTPISDDELSSVTGGTGASLSGLSVTKRADASSPKLFQACCKGAHFDTAVLTG